MVKGKAPIPRMPKVARITKVEQLLPTAREMVSRTAANMYGGVEVKKGQKVLFINDTTADQLVVQALTIAILEKGAHVNTITMEGFRGLKDAGEMVDNMFSNNWYPKWVWNAANEADIVLLTAFIKAPHTPLPELSNKPVVVNVEMTADLMLSEYGAFPVELRDTIDEVAWEKLFNCTKVKWADLEGTDISINLTPQDWKQATERNMKRMGNPYQHGHLMLPAPSPEMNGIWLISSIMFGGPVPRTTMHIEKGKVVKVEGGGKYGERLRESFAKYATLFKSSCPGPGVSWVTTIGICTNPKVRRSPFLDELEGSARVYAQAFGHRRSGVFHTSVGRPTRVKASITSTVDKGEEFGGKSWMKVRELRKLISGFGCWLIQNHKGHFEENAHLERSHRTEDDEFYIPRALHIKSEADLLNEAIGYIYYYDNPREHSAINYQTPFAYLRS